MKSIRAIILVIVILLTGCNTTENPEKPFIFSYDYNSIEPEHFDVINQWLTKAKLEKEIKVHSYEIDRFRYVYVPTYKDIEISFIYFEGEGSLKEYFKKGTSDDEIFIKIKMNTTICCNHFIYETDDSKDIKNNFEG